MDGSQKTIFKMSRSETLFVDSLRSRFQGPGHAPDVRASVHPWCSESPVTLVSTIRGASQTVFTVFPVRSSLSWSPCLGLWNLSNRLRIAFKLELPQ